MGCGRASSPAAPAETAPAVVDDDATTTPTAAAPAVDRALVELRVAAKKRLAADRAVASNAFGYEQALSRHERERVESRMAVHVPRDLDGEAVERELRALAEAQGMLTLGFELHARVPARALPTSHRGDAPFAYSDDQLFDERPFTWSLGGATEAGLVRLYRAIQGSGAPLPVVRRAVRSASGLTLEGVFLVAAPLRPPRHVVETMTLETIALAAGVELEGDDEDRAREALAPLIAEHEALLSELQKAVDALGLAHLAGRRMEAYRALVERVGQAPLPDVVEGSADD